MSRTINALLCAVALSSAGVLAQTAMTPEQHLEAARQLLGSIQPPPATAGQSIATLQRDFAAFASAYISRTASAPKPMAADASRAAAGAPAVDAAASGSTPPVTAASAASDWRARYLLVESDLTTLIGPPNVQAPAAMMPGLNPSDAQKLQQVRQHLETLYAATINSRDGNPIAHTGPDTAGAPVPPTGEAPPTMPRDQAERSAAAVAGNTQAMPTQPASQPAIGSSQPPASSTQPPSAGGQPSSTPPPSTGGQPPVSGTQPPSPGAQTPAGVPQPTTGAALPGAATQPVAGAGQPAGAQTTGTPQAAPAPANTTLAIDPGVAAALLERMQTLVDDVMAGKKPKQAAVGTTGSVEGAGKINVDRSTLDELRSEIAQLRLMLAR